MKITRVGARADNGPSSITLPKIAAHLTSSGNEVSLTETDISDFVTKAHYNYDMRLSFAEIGKIIEAVVSRPESNSQKIASEIGPYLRHIIKLSNICINN
ncbi:MAG: hypothetical protein GY938_17145 [Ketobacter sp.]|nr:hypothetical protein [Ketobacter sp.]